MNLNSTWRPLLAAHLGLGILVSAATAQKLPPRGNPSPVLLKYGSFDPAVNPPEVPLMLRGAEDTRLWIVQFGALPTDEMRQSVRAAGGEVHSYLPESAYVVRMPHGSAAQVQRLTSVRSVSHYHPAFRLERFLLAESATGSNKTRRYNIVVVDKRQDKPALLQKLNAMGAQVHTDGGQSLLIEATLTGPQLVQAARQDEVLWIDRWSSPEDDMDNARIQGGADYIETQGGYTGQGIVGHQFEGLNTNHVDWNNTPIGYPAGCTSSSGHGHNTAGIVYGNGTSSPLARGMAPDAQAYFTSCRSNRYSTFQGLINNFGIMFTTASWGSARTRNYTSVSAEADDICFDLDLVWTNSQSNAGNQDSRAEAWAKNVFSCGGVAHRNNSIASDDSWAAGGASIGPASDNRIKPDFTAYYDNIATSSSNGSWTSSFGGTSGATPIVAGHNALAIQMYTDGVFGPVRKPGGTRFENKPHFPTLKALQAANAAQYPFTSSSNDNLRVHQGWGFPNLKSMYDNRNVMFIVDETDVIKQGEGIAYTLDVPSGRSELKISMSFADPAANPASQLARINDLTLRVTAPNGTRYWGNAGLRDGNYSQTGGSRDRLNTIENVILRSPAAGNWVVEVIAYSVVQDSHVETTAVDADYGLVVNGATFVSKRSITVQVGSITETGPGCLGSVTAPNLCASGNANGGTSIQQTRQWEYAYPAQSTRALTVTGMELFTGSVSGGTVTVPVAIYLASGSAPAATPLATSTMRVGGPIQFYSATFASPVSIPANSRFFVSMTHGNQTYVSSISNGTSITGYYRNGNWIQSGLALQSTFRVVCAGGNQKLPPVQTIDGTPEIGQTLTTTLRDARPSAPAILFIGNSDTTWSGGSLPFDAGAIGAPGCILRTSLNVVWMLQTNANGQATVPLAIPNTPSLIGANGFQQWAVDDPTVNNLGIVLSNSMKIVLGG